MYQADAPVEPQLSVIIPCFNGARTIGLQLEALRLQADPPRFEVLVVDNRSTDDLAAAVAPFQGIDEFELRVLRATEHQGSSYARNIGIREARAEAIQFCDADDVVHEHWVRHGFDSATVRPLWSGRAMSVHPHVFDGGVAGAREAAGPEGEGLEIIDSWPVPYPIIMGANFGGRRSTFLTLRGFDQAASHAGDDNDLAARAVKHGFTISISMTCVVAYRERTALRDRLRSAFRENSARARMAARLGIARTERLRPVPSDLARALLATLLAPVRRSRPTGSELVMRWAYVLGNVHGTLAARRHGDAFTRQETLGLGLDAPATTDAPSVAGDPR